MSKEVLAPMPGKIISISVEVGQKIEEDDEIAVIESMKMENSIYAPCDGTIKSVDVKEGDNVKESSLIAVIE